VSILKHIKQEPEVEQRLAQGYIPKQLREAVAKQMKQDRQAGIKVNWNTLIEAACRSYLTERKKK
jgi:hypothetical protein